VLCTVNFKRIKMKSLIEVFRMTEVSKKVRANIIVKLGIAINDKYAMNITQPLVAELVYQLDAEHEIFKNEMYLKHVNGTA
jgi:hypothetical protein